MCCTVGRIENQVDTKISNFLVNYYIFHLVMRIIGMSVGVAVGRHSVGNDVSRPLFSPSPPFLLLLRHVLLPHSAPSWILS